MSITFDVSFVKRIRMLRGRFRGVIACSLMLWHSMPQMGILFEKKYLSLSPVCPHSLYGKMKFCESNWKHWLRRLAQNELVKDSIWERKGKKSQRERQGSV